MRAIVPLLLILYSYGCCTAQDGPRIVGLVLNDATSAPLGKVVVLVRKSCGDLFGAVTDSKGEFSIPTISPGKYDFFLERAGYLSVSPYGSPLEIQPGSQSLSVTFKLIPQGIIAGRVTRTVPDLSEPLHVRLWKTTLNRLDWAEPQEPVPVEDDGSFMIGDLAPGRYLLEKPGQALAEAEVLDVMAGTEIRDIQLTARPLPAIRLSGLARFPTKGATMIEAYAYLKTKDPSGSWVPLRRSTQISRKTGAFTFTSIPPGDYRIVARLTVRAGGSSQKYLGVREVRVQEGQGVTYVSLDFTPAAVIRGTVSDEAGLPAGSHEIYASLSPDGTDEGISDSAVLTTPKGYRFQVTPGRNRLFVSNQSESFRSVKSIWFNGRPYMADTPLDVPSEGGSLEILLGGPEPGREIAGRIRDEAGRGAAGAVVAAWNGQGAWAYVQADALGRFTIPRAPHGKLYVAAWENQVTPPLAGIPLALVTFRTAFEGRATEVPALGADRVTVRLTAIPRVASESKVLKLR
ncbi:MAG: carboxypeptidase regulatory-like domain-containing protein [Acidobacteriaceae bacterium]|nr:carboxypeptidase regulatory-like domain-containing protein [Acidobacteriaceae bacterium]